MKNRYNTLQSRIFITMLILVIIVSISIILVAVFQYREQAKDYHKSRLDRKESAVKRDIQYHLDNTTFPLISGKLPVIFREKIFEMSHVHSLEIVLYDMQGNLLITSRASFELDSLSKSISTEIVNELKNDINHRVVSESKYEGEKYLSIYSYIYDRQFNPIGILNIPFLLQSDFYEKELNELLTRIGIVFILAIIFSIILAYFSSRIISLPIKELADRLKNIRINKQNERLVNNSSAIELNDLINAYNGMIEDLEESAIKLAKTERESAWREMAKQVAHEIKNPLTPMRLSMQNFERKFNPNDTDIEEKVKDFSESMIQQIDTLTSIATAFSDFAKMPVGDKSALNIVEIIQNTLDIFTEEYVHFYSEKEEIIAQFDKNQLVRVITNLVTNALHATSEIQNPAIEVVLKDLNENIKITVSDNGIGISEDNKLKIFEPKFTTKTSGMGLGLAMVKNILENANGKIEFTSVKDKGTVFSIYIPKE